MVSNVPSIWESLPTLADTHIGSLSGPDSHLQKVGKELSPGTSSKPCSGLSVLWSWGPAPSHPPARVCHRHSSEGTQRRLMGRSALPCDIPSFCYFDFLFHLKSGLPLKVRKAIQSFTTNNVLVGWRPSSEAPFVVRLLFLQFRLQMNLKGEGPPGIEISHLYFASFISHSLIFFFFFFLDLQILFMVQTGQQIETTNQKGHIEIHESGFWFYYLTQLHFHPLLPSFHLHVSHP